MDRFCFYTAGRSPALSFAQTALQKAGFNFSDTPHSQVTHLLLPIPSLDGDGKLKGGGSLEDVLASLPPNICIIGGSLPKTLRYPTLDLMEDPVYVAQNAYITAHCALGLAIRELNICLRGCPVLVMGWGRIGKCLAALLRAVEAQVTVAARKPEDLAILQALGYQTTTLADIPKQNFTVIFNTAPTMLLPEYSAPCLKIDLASQKGIGGEDVIHARGLPGLYAPKESGELIAQRVIFHIAKEDSL